MLIAVGTLIALALVTAAVLAARPRPARFAFEDREDYVLLEIRNRIESDDTSLITMIALREAVRLKLLRDYRRLLVKVHRLTFANDASFWLLIGGLGPLFQSEAMKSAFVCRPRSDTAKRFRESGIAEDFDTESAALEFLRSPAPSRPVLVDRDWVESLLAARGRSTAPPMRRAA